MDKLQTTLAQLVSKDDIQLFLEAFTNVVKNTKEDFTLQSNKNIKLLEEVLSIVENKIEDINSVKEDINSNISISENNIENSKQNIKEIKDWFEEIKQNLVIDIQSQVKNGDKPTEEELLNLIRPLIPELPKIEEIKLDTGEDIVNKINDLDDEAPKIDAKHISNLPNFNPSIISNSNKYLGQLLDVNLSGLTQTNGKYNLGSGLPSLTSGSVLFSNGSTIAQDNSNFFWDNTTKRLGLGTNSPEANLHVEGSAFPVFKAVRTTTNTNTFNSGATMMTKTSGDMTDGFGGGFIFGGQDNAASGNWGIIGAVRDGSDTSGALVMYSYASGSASERMRISSAGKVGIGTTTPTGLLQVHGSANEVIVDSTGRLGIGFANASAMNASAAYKLQINGAFTFGDGTNILGRATYTAVGGNPAFASESGKGFTFYVDDANVRAIDISSAGKVGIGTTSPTANLDIRSTSASQSIILKTTASNGAVTLSLDRATYSGSNDAGIYFKTNGTSNYAFGTGEGIAGSNSLSVYNYNTSNTAWMITDTAGFNQFGINTSAVTGGAITTLSMNNGNGSLTNQYGLYINRASTGDTLAVTNAYGIRVNSINPTSGSLTTAYGMYVGNLNATNSYGLYLAGTAGTNRYGIYQTDNSTINYFNGSIGIGTTAPGAKLQIDTGAAATKGLIVKGFTAQSVNLQEWQNSTGQIQGYVSSAGDLVFNTTDGAYTAVEYARNNVTSAIRVRNTGTTVIQLHGDSGTPTYFNGGNVIVGATTGNANAILDVQSTTKAFMPPRMTTTQKNAISSPTAGMVVYDSTLNKLCVYGAASWETVTSV